MTRYDRVRQIAEESKWLTTTMRWCRVCIRNEEHMTKPRLLRVRRLVEYVGDPDAVLAQLSHSMKEGDHDVRVTPRGHDHVKIRVTISQLGGGVGE